ncbi:conserved hypothetical protein [Burkholderia vietnamiensis]|nr:conserved hypothetical protein [Burkholderia vietnamiensis]
MIGIVVRTHDARRVSPAARQPARVRRVVPRAARRTRPRALP